MQTKTVEEMAEAAIPEISEEKRKEINWTSNEVVTYQDGFVDGFIAGYRSQPTGWVDIENGFPDKDADVVFENMDGKYIAATYSIERNRFERYKNAADGDRMAAYYYITVSVKRWRYLSEPLPGELPGVLPSISDALAMATEMDGGAVVDPECFMLHHTELYKLIQFCQTPKQGKKD